MSPRPIMSPDLSRAKILIPFFVLGIVLLYVSTKVTDSRTLQAAVFFGVGVIIPALIVTWRY